MSVLISDEFKASEKPAKHSIAMTKTPFELSALARRHHLGPLLGQLRKVVWVNRPLATAARAPPLPGCPYSCQRRFTNSLEPSGSLLQAIAGRASRIARLSAVFGCWWREGEAFMISAR